MLANKPKLDISRCYYNVRSKGVRQGGGFGVKTPS